MFKVVVDPGHIRLWLEAAEIMGLSTVIKMVSVPVQPFESIPFTIYRVVEEGETVIEETASPSFQEYVAPPEAVSVIELPAQIVELPGVTVIIAVQVG